jgi:hypothetical protein
MHLTVRPSNLLFCQPMDWQRGSEAHITVLFLSIATTMACSFSADVAADSIMAGMH